MKLRLGFSALLIAAIALGVSVTTNSASGADAYEVWAIDQSNSPGTAFGGTLYIWDGHDLERGHEAAAAAAEMIDLGRRRGRDVPGEDGRQPGATAHAGRQRGADARRSSPSSPSGHVVFMDAVTARPVDVHPHVGRSGRRAPGPLRHPVARRDLCRGGQPERQALRADQHRLRHEHVRPRCRGRDRSREMHDAERLRRVRLRCFGPTMHRSARSSNRRSRFSFVTLRGGGLFVIDSTATPMAIVAEYDRATVHPQRLPRRRSARQDVHRLGRRHARRTCTRPTSTRFPSTGFSASNPPNTPAPNVVFSEDVEHADAHGATLTKHSRYLWVADRGRNFLFVVDTADRRGRQPHRARRRALPATPHRT